MQGTETSRNNTAPAETGSARTTSTPTRAASTGVAGADSDSPYPKDAGHGMRPPAGRNGLAVAAMVLGVIGLITSIVFVGGLLGAIGLILGIAALMRARRTGVGRGMSITGVVTSSLAIVVSILAAILLAWYANNTQKCYQPESFQQYKQCVHQQLTKD